MDSNGKAILTYGQLCVFLKDTGFSEGNMKQLELILKNHINPSVQEVCATLCAVWCVVCACVWYVRTQIIYEEFLESLATICVLRDPNPYLALHTKLPKFLETQIIAPVMPYVMAKEMKARKVKKRASNLKPGIKSMMSAARH